MISDIVKQGNISHVDFKSGSWLKCSVNDSVMIITSNMLPYPVIFDSSAYANHEITFNSIFRGFKQFCFAETILNIKKRIVNARKLGLGGKMLTKREARLAWKVMDILKYQKHPSKSSYLDEGWGKVEYIINDLSQFEQISAREISSLLNLFSRSCIGLVYPKKIEKIKDIYWNSISSNFV